MNKIYLVFGCSATGKETFILNAKKNNNEIIDIMNWNVDKIEIIQESIDYIKQYSDDPIGDKRVEIIERIGNIPNENKIILIKGQNIDFKSGIIEKIKEKYSAYPQEIIFLVSDVKTIFARGKKKSWFTESDNNIDDWSEHQHKTAAHVKDLKEYNITTIDTTNGYKLVEFPEY